MGNWEIVLDGLVEMTNDEYHSAPGISKSHLDLISGKSALHYWQRYINPDREPEDPTPAKLMGTAIHIAILEPDLLHEHVVKGLDIEKRSNADKKTWEEFRKSHYGKVILSADDYEHVLKVRDAVHRHPVAAGLLRNGKAEQTVFATDKETGELIKCRIDYLPDNGSMILDVKSAEDASPIGFGKSAANYRYPVQTAWYQDVVRQAFGECPEHWAFLAFEKEPPYAVGIYFIEPDDVARAHIQARQDFLRIIDHRRNNYWPDYGAEPRALELPYWAKRD